MFSKAVLSALTATVAVSALTSSTAYADVYYVPGHYQPVRHVERPAWWYAGVGLVGTSILDQSGGPEALHSGGGLSAWIGVDLSRTFSIELGWMGSLHNPVTYMTESGYRDTSYLLLNGVTLDGKIHLARGSVDPYLQAGAGVYVIGDTAAGVADSVGPGYQLGGGIDFRVARVVTLGVRALYRGIEMGPRDGGPADTFLHAATFEGSVALHF